MRAVHCRVHKKRLANGSKSRRMCEACYSQWRRKHSRNPEAERESQRLRRYGITSVAFHNLWSRQGGKCKICKEVPSTPHVDHDHKTGKVRGLLCASCNLGLGHFKDDTVRLRAAVRYLT